MSWPFLLFNNFYFYFEIFWVLVPWEMFSYVHFLYNMNMVLRVILDLRENLNSIEKKSGKIISPNLSLVANVGS